MAAPSGCLLQEPLRVATEELFKDAAAHVEGLLSPYGWPEPDEALQCLSDLRTRAGRSEGHGSLCQRQALLVDPLLRAYGTVTTSVASWNHTSLASQDRGSQGVALRDLLNGYNEYLVYQSTKAELLQDFRSRTDLFDGWPYAEGERLMGLLLRSAWLAFAPRKLMVPSHCACRDTPETQSILFDKFDDLRLNGVTEDFSFGLFFCDHLAYEPDSSDWNALLELAVEPAAVHCLPRDVVVRAACAQKAALQGDAHAAQRLLNAAVNLMAMSSDCFEHTPWTGRSRGLGTAEVFYNWATFSPSALWRWTPFSATSISAAAIQQQISSMKFGRAMCETELQAVCLGPRPTGVTILKPKSPVPHDAFLLQCGDSYGDWRRVRVLRGADGSIAKRGLAAGASRSRAWLLHVSSLGLDNLWHLLHVLLPALSRVVESNGESPHDVILDGLSRREGRSLNSTIAGRTKS
eukprot:TRINITY_DN34254_c0_g1_i2.p1 TRINITY_DN34254_c0_g1~~TRINITY_DN34254_c0_g1_i2.p1  ORF type:complete len:463 (-),score=46.25 TRINITY_DN34254_c0_g1_i2:134-1522(-)